MGIFFLLMSLLFLWGIGIAIHAVITARSLSWQRRVYALVTLGWFVIFLIGMDGWMLGQTIAMYYGGYTHLGKIENGRHFVGNKGSYREVTPEQWKFLQKTERCFGEQWWLVSALGMSAFLLMGALGKRILGDPPGIKIERMKEMKWIQRSFNPAVWWLCNEGDEGPLVEISQNEDTTWRWIRHTTIERDGIGPAQGELHGLQRAKEIALDGLHA